MAKPRLGYWGTTPGDPDQVAGMLKWEERIGRRFNIYRGRGGEGSFNQPIEWLMDESQDALDLGKLVSLQIACKTGEGQQRVGVPWKEIARGDHDDLITERFFQIRNRLPSEAGRQPFEVQSEANIQKGAVDAQPNMGTPAEYPPFARRVHEIATEVGVRDRLVFMLSMTRGPWDSKEWETWTKGLDDVLDVYAVDGYSMPRTAQAKSFESICASVIRAARSKSKRWAVMETGCQEHPTDKAYKAKWYDDAASFLKREGHDCYGVVFNVSNDGPKGWPPTTSPGSLMAFVRLCNSGAFRA